LQPSASFPEGFWRDLTARYDRRIRAYARTTHCRNDEIDELVWDVWAEAVPLEAQLRTCREPWDILLPLVRRACADTVRRIRRERSLGGDVAVAPSREADEISLRLRMDALLRKLPKQQRKAVDFRFRWGWPYWAVAAALGIAESTARVHVARGMRTLRRLLGVITG
jgi:RNA polymerase sigma factor (sigma-70 family)